MGTNVFVSNQFSSNAQHRQPVVPAYVPDEIEPVVNVEQQHPVEEQKQEEKNYLYRPNEEFNR